MKTIKLSMFAVCAVLVTGISSADVTPAMQPTSKAYVTSKMATKQAKIGDEGTAGSVVTYTSTKGSVGSRNIYNSGSAYSGQQNYLIEANHANTAIQNGLNGHLTCTQRDANNNCLLWQINSMSGTYMPHN